jgi:hypothetical protein
MPFAVDWLASAFQLYFAPAIYIEMAREAGELSLPAHC